MTKPLITFCHQALRAMVIRPLGACRQWPVRATNLVAWHMNAAPADFSVEPNQVITIQPVEGETMLSFVGFGLAQG